MNVYVIEDNYFLKNNPFVLSHSLWRESGVPACFWMCCVYAYCSEWSKTFM